MALLLDIHCLCWGKLHKRETVAYRTAESHTLFDLEPNSVTLLSSVDSQRLQALLYTT